MGEYALSINSLARPEAGLTNIARSVLTVGKQEGLY